MPSTPISPFVKTVRVSVVFFFRSCQNDRATHRQTSGSWIFKFTLEIRFLTIFFLLCAPYLLTAWQETNKKKTRCVLNTKYKKYTWARTSIIVGNIMRNKISSWWKEQKKIYISTTTTMCMLMSIIARKKKKNIVWMNSVRDSLWLRVCLCKHISENVFRCDIYGIPRKRILKNLVSKPSLTPTLAHVCVWPNILGLCITRIYIYCTCTTRYRPIPPAICDIVLFTIYRALAIDFSSSVLLLCVIWRMSVKMFTHFIISHRLKIYIVYIVNKKKANK